MTNEHMTERTTGNDTMTKILGGSPLAVLGLALGIVALKIAILYPLAQAFGYCRRADAGVFAVALSQAGEGGGGAHGRVSSTACSRRSITIPGVAPKSLISMDAAPR